tara:strand:+ start:543 stop:1529 length:987 start_codon:yes stop_codon:yes gene_type:complete
MNFLKRRNNYSELLNLMRAFRVSKPGLCVSNKGLKHLKKIKGFGKIVIIPDITEINKNKLLRKGWQILEKPQLSICDGILILDEEAFSDLMRKLEAFSKAGYLILPGNSQWIVPNSIINLSKLEKAWNCGNPINYISRSNLSGHYLEFGTFWGRSFYTNFFKFSDWLKGDFFAFDSFSGLSQPLEIEEKYSAYDFQKGNYNCNKKTFEAIGTLLKCDFSRIKVIPGYFSESLKNTNQLLKSLKPHSVSVCYVDCDLLEPTLEVLTFVEDLLEPGALIYFDDWRLCRASSLAGERGAAIEWLNKNHKFELIEFDRTNWQSQWFIFQNNC